VNATEQNETTELAARLLKSAGVTTVDFKIEALPGGRNNKVFRIAHHDGRAHLLKCYFHHPHDPRNRLGQESAFLQYLEKTGCAFGPNVLATDPNSHAALLEYIEGSRIRLNEVGAADVDQACEFFRQANAFNYTPSARALPTASEACFSIAEHLQTTQRRVDRLAQIAVTDSLDESATSFVNHELVPLWNAIRTAIEAGWPAEGDRITTIPTTDRCLSPSDFGFHNALREANGRIRFLDFEYAGWDDPAKLVCDFANQPDLLLPVQLSHRFRQAVLEWSCHPEQLSRRVDAVEPLYQVKWACICLNDFLQTGQTRRLFTDGESADHHARREIQLGRARQMLARGQRTVSHP
jgi:hypothetical protein